MSVFKFRLTIVGTLLTTQTIANAGGTGFVIPDNNPAGGSSSYVETLTQTIPASFAVDISISHTWVGDLVATIEHNNGINTVSATLFNRVGATTSDPFGYDSDLVLSSLYEFSDYHNGNFWTAAAAGPTVPGGFGYRASTNLFQSTVAASYSEVSLGSIFAGRTYAGTWTLRISDHEAFDTGFVNFWYVGDAAFPSPGALPLLGLAGLICNGRRRRE